LADFAKQFPEWDEKVANLIWELRPPQVVPLLEKRLVDRKLPAQQRAQIVDIVASSADPGAGKVLLQSLQADTPAQVRERILANLKLFLPGKWKNLRQSTELGGVVQRFLGKAETRAAGLALVGAAEMQDAIGQVVRIAKNTKEPGAIRTAAIQTLGRLKGGLATKALVRELLDVQPAALRVEVVNALGRQATKAARAALQKIVLVGKGELALKLAAVEGLAASRPGTVWLLDANDRKELPADLKGDVGRLLRNSPYQRERNRALLAFPAPGRLDPKKLPSIARLLPRKGDPARGRQLLAASVKNDLQCL